MLKDALIFVAGHRGLVGSAIVNELKSRGYHNIITRTHKELDLTNQVETEQFFSEHKPDYVFLAAAKVGGIVANNTYRGSFIYENLMIQNNVIHHSYLNNVKKLLFLGSTCIYPKDSQQPIKENYLLNSPLEYTNEPYAIAKIAGIKLCESYNIQYNTNYISVMPTNLYGYNDNFDLEKSHVLPALLRKIHLGKALELDDWEIIKEDLNKLPIGAISGKSPKEDILKVLTSFGITKKDDVVSVEIWGSGTPRREFLWSEDMAKACVFIMQQVNFNDLIKDKGSFIRNTHTNIGTGKDISIKELAFSIKKHLGFRGEFTFNTSKPDGTLKKLTDVSKLNKLGWSHDIETEEGIQKLYNWYKASK